MNKALTKLGDIRCVRLACQPTSQQYCSLILNQHRPLDLGMGCPTRRTRPNLPENSPTRPDPKSLMGGLRSNFLTRYD